MYSLVIGNLGAFAPTILILAMKMSDLTQGICTRDAAEYQAAAVEPDPVATVMSGPQVYNNACIACHGTGVGGAPVVGEAAAWALFLRRSKPRKPNASATCGGVIVSALARSAIVLATRSTR